MISASLPFHSQLNVNSCRLVRVPGTFFRHAPAGNISGKKKSIVVRLDLSSFILFFPVRPIDHAHGAAARVCNYFRVFYRVE
jgi:hypothetical protein